MLTAAINVNSKKFGSKHSRLPVGVSLHQIKQQIPVRTRSAARINALLFLDHKMVDTPKVVFTKTMENNDWSNTQLAKGSLTEEIAALKEQDGNAPSYYYKEDLVTFGPPARKPEEILLVFHHPWIVNIASEMLQGEYKDQLLQMLYF